MRSFSDRAASIRPCLALLMVIYPATLDVANAQLDSSLVCVRPTDPRGLGVHEGGTLYVLDPEDGVVHEYNSSDGQYLGVLTDSTGTAGGGIEVVGDYVFVSPASDSDSTVEKLSVTNGSVSMMFPDGDKSVAPGGYDVAVDANGTVYVSNFLDVGVEVYNGTTGAYKERILHDISVLGIAFGPDDIMYASVPDDDSVKRFERSSDGTNFTLIDAPIAGAGGSRVRSGAWGLTIYQPEYLVYVVWSGSREITEYSSTGEEMRYWGIGSEKLWWSSDPETSRGASGDDLSSTSATNTNNGTVLTPWYIATDSAGNIYVTASEEEGVNGTTGFLDRDIFKYDGASGDSLGRFSTCFGEGYTRTDAPTSSPTSAPTAVSSGSTGRGLASPAPTTSPTPVPTLNPASTTAPGSAAPTNASDAISNESNGTGRRVVSAGWLALTTAVASVLVGGVVLQG